MQRFEKYCTIECNSVMKKNAYAFFFLNLRRKTYGYSKEATLWALASQGL